MNKKSIIQKIKKYSEEKLRGESTGHDWWHTFRVWKMSLKIAQKEKGADLFVVQAAALLHDIADWKFHGGDDSVGSKIAKDLLIKLGADENSASKISEIIKNISFKGGTGLKMKIKEGKIVQDADRLDALGTIGVARAFAYGGKIGRPIYDPNVKPRKFRNFGEFKKLGNSHTINHFYEKLLRLKGLMNTGTGKEIASKRHKIVADFLKNFLKEWEVKY